MTVKLRIGLFFLLFFVANLCLHAQSTSEELFRADKQFELNAFGLALKSYQAVVNLEPANTHATKRMGECLYQLNRLGDAVNWFAKAAEMPETTKDATLLVGKTLMQLGDYSGAKKWFLQHGSFDKTMSDYYLSACEFAMANISKTPVFEIFPVGINAPSSDFAPAFYGDKLVFSSARTDLKRKSDGGKGQTAWTGASANQLFVSKINAADNSLGIVSFFKSDLANAYNEAPLAFSGNGKRVAFCRNNYLDGTRQLATGNINLSLYLGEVVESGWMNVRAFPHNISDYGTGYPYLSEDGNTLFFASNRPNGYGGWDLYRSTWDGTKWTVPTNLGPSVNTVGNEITPYIADKQLYFSSDFHTGFGGLDVFAADIEAQNFKNIVHLGSGINSPADDYGFIYDKQRNLGFVVSNRPGGKGNEDVYRVSKKIEVSTPVASSPVVSAPVTYSEAEVPVPTKTPPASSAKTSTSKEIVVKSLPGKILAKDGGKGISDVNVVAISSTNSEIQTTKTNEMGEYFLTIDPSSTYKVVLSKSGFVESKYTIDGQKVSNRLPETAFENVSVPVVAATKTEPATPSATKPAAKHTGTAANTKSVMYEYNPEVAATETKSASSVLKSMEKDPIEETFSGYAVQLASYIGEPTEKDMERFEGLKQLGNIYSDKVGNTTKVRIGVFASEEEAVLVQSKAKKQNIKDAFVIREKNVANQLLMPSVLETQTAVTHSTKSEVTAPVAVSSKSAVKAVATPVVDAPSIPARFSVQVAALSQSGSTLNLSNYAVLNDVGNLYTVNDDGVTKIRLGIWEDPDAAAQAKESVIKRGFKDAMVVTELANDAAGLVKRKTPAPKTSLTPKEEKVEKPVVHSLPTPAVVTPAPAKMSPYKVQVATMQNAKNFPKQVLDGISGTYETKVSGKNTNILLSDYPDLESAVKAKNAVRTKGYRDAFVVKEEGGKLVPVKF